MPAIKPSRRTKCILKALYVKVQDFFANIIPLKQNMAQMIFPLTG